MDIPPFVALLLVALLSLLLFATRRRKGGSPSSPGDGRRLPPSPPGLPFLGHLPLLGSLPHRRLHAMSSTHGPAMLLHMGRVPTVVVSSAAAAQEVMKTRDLAFASRPRVRMPERLFYGRDMAFAPYGEHWRQARRVSVLHLLSQRRVHSFRRARELEAAAMLARVRGRGDAADAAVVNVNLNAVLISYSSGIISRAAFGVADVRSYGIDGGGDDGEGERLTKLFDEFEELLGMVTVGELLPWLAWVDTLMGVHAKAARTSAEMDAFLERILADHRHQRRRRRDGGGGDDDHRDFVDVLLDVNEAEHDDDDARRVLFDNDSIKGIILNMFAAGTDTTYTTLVWAMAELINHPHEMRKLQDEIRAAVAGSDGCAGVVTEDHLETLRYHRRVIKETLRLHAPVPLLLPRETTEDTEVLGYHVPAGTRVVVNAWAIARDPAAWERAEEFLPERFADDDVKTTPDYLLGQGQGQDFRFVPFGAGRRGCPGVGFAAPGMELALANLLYHFDWELPAGGPSKVEMGELKGLSVRLKTTLHLTAKPWSPL